MKMTSLLVVLLIGLVLCAVWLRLSPRRATVTATPPPPNPARDDHRVLNAWQAGITFDPRNDYDAEARRRMMEKLKREEERQRPWEGRN